MMMMKGWVESKENAEKVDFCVRNHGWKGSNIFSFSVKGIFIIEEAIFVNFFRFVLNFLLFRSEIPSMFCYFSEIYLFFLCIFLEVFRCYLLEGNLQSRFDLIPSIWLALSLEFTEYFLRFYQIKIRFS